MPPLFPRLVHCFPPLPLHNVFGGSDEESTKFTNDMNNLAYTDRDLISMLSEDEAFRTLKVSLRQRGCVTNAYLKENAHFYIKHVKDVRAARENAAAAKRGRVSRRKRTPTTVADERSRHTPLSAAA
jgi:hypothetical protein